MDLKQPKQNHPNRDYLTLQHTYNTLTNLEEPISIYAVPIPFIANHIFHIKTNPQSINSNIRDLLLKVANQQPSVAQSSKYEEAQEESFDIGEKEESMEIVKLGIKGMKSLANVKSLANMGSYLSNFITKKK